MKRITLTVVVSDDYMSYTERRRIKVDLAQAAVTIVREQQLNLETLEVKVGTLRRKR